MGVITGAEARSRVMEVGDSTRPGGEGKGEAQDLQHSGRPRWRNRAGAYPLEPGGRGHCVHPKDFQAILHRIDLGGNLASL